MSSLFRILEKQGKDIKEIYDEQNISGNIYMAVLDYIDEHDIVFDFLENFDGNPNSYAMEIFHNEGCQALELLDRKDLDIEELADEWEYNAGDLLYGIKIMSDNLRWLSSQSDKTTLIVEIY